MHFCFFSLYSSLNKNQELDSYVKTENSYVSIGSGCKLLGMCTMQMHSILKLDFGIICTRTGSKSMNLMLIYVQWQISLSAECAAA